MKLGFSTLSQFMKPWNEIINTAIKDNFNSIEILAEGQSHPDKLLENRKLDDIDFKDLTLYMHAPSIDLNLASVNKGIRQESIRQTCQALKLAEKIGVNTLTIHPGIIGRNDDRIRKYIIEHTIESIKTCQEYMNNNSIKTKLAIENMPNRFRFIGSRLEELEYIQKNTDCYITIDTGHANTSPDCREFFKLKNIEYYHLHDNNGKNDSHLALGDGNLDLNLLKKVENGILELNSYNKVLKSRKVLNNILN
ncbi:sugar phosphate isomerase/epimerase family protein [Methanosphaera sp. WGK6]|uniref:sugar phosphate isomerase/epimerase family protein n=1 Tax=Methanosphaera sp. WGK6 TaxID=1561964 RepID=UPI00084BFAC0|nr:sugar phosphate isomerase/epimerase family protein [Methanosphaera sp. WGK6]OED29508.1 sugar phosphate isomerase [Methanosphaera sp. WGK6]